MSTVKSTPVTVKAEQPSTPVTKPINEMDDLQFISSIAIPGLLPSHIPRPNLVKGNSSHV